MAKARTRGVRAEIVEIETFDSLLSRLWRQLPNRSLELVSAVSRKTRLGVQIPLPDAGKSNPIVRLNGLPVTTLPGECFQLGFDTLPEWADLRDAEKRVNGRIICTREADAWAWGHEATIRSAFPTGLLDVKAIDLGERLHDLSANFHLKGFIEKGICTALVRGKPLLHRSSRAGSTLIVDRHTPDSAALAGLIRAVGGPAFGKISDGKSTPTPDHPVSEELFWAEAVDVDLQQVNGRFWLLVRPDVWIWPRWARDDAAAFLDKRTGGRFNEAADKILSAWIALLLPRSKPGEDHELIPFDGIVGPGNPRFVVNDRTAFSRRPGQ